MKDKFIANIKSLFKSTIDNRTLFERRKNSFIAPLVIFVLIICMMSVPTYMLSKNVSKEDLTKKFPQISEPMKYLLTSSLDCSVQNGSLVCEENAEQINIVIGDTIKYTVIANLKSVTIDTSIDNKVAKNTDNLIILLENYIKIRYSHRDYVNDKVDTNEILGDYSEFEGYNFKQMSERLNSNPSLIDNEVSDFIYKTHQSTLDTKLLVNIASSLFSFVLFTIVSSIILKWPTIFKRKKGFKFIECLKLSITSSLPAFIVATLLFIVAGIDFSIIFSTIYFVRVLYIYFKYISSRKNNIFNELYQETNEERFKI